MNHPTRFKSWLYGIVLNTRRNGLRRHQVICFSLEAMVGNLVDEPPPVTGSSPDPQIVEELHTALLEAANTLFPKNRSVISLFYHEQFSLQEVANRLNISVSEVVRHSTKHQRSEKNLLAAPTIC